MRAVIALLALLAGVVHAQTYPAKPIRFIVPIAPGSVTDVVVRAAAQELAPRLGQPLVIDNRAGASGIIGAEACARAPADGYTICAVYHAIMSFNALTHDKLPYDAERDFAPVTNLYFVTEALVVPAALPVASVEELRSHARSNPRALNLGTLGEGSLQELFLAWLNREWQVAIQGIPYKGGGPIASAVTAGEIQMGLMGVGNFVGAIQSGRVKPLAVSSQRRAAALPNVPTMDEAGLAGFRSRPWWGLAAPAGTPPAAIERLNAEFVKLLREPKFLEFLEGRFVEPAPGTQQEFAAFLKADREVAASLVRLARQGKN